MKLSENRASGFLRVVRPEDRLLVSCARTRIDAECAESIRHLLNDAIDWEYFLNLAERHHLLPLVYWNLNRTCAYAVPKIVFMSLWAHFEYVAQRNRTLSLELIRLVKLFESHEISVIPYKGPTAAVFLYKNIALREFGDLDFLVRREDLSRVCAILETDGYLTKTQLTPTQKRHHERVAKEYMYCRHKGPGDNQLTDPICLEPHWSITMPKFPFPIDYSGLWRRAQRIDFRDTQILSFAPEDAILILCVIGSKSQWKRFLMICDFAEAVQTYKDIDWANCLERAGKLGCERMLLITIVLASELVDSIPSLELLERARSDRKVLKLAQQICDELFREVRPSVLGSSLFSPLLWSMRERPRDKVLYFIRTLTTPRGTHLRRLPLLGPLFPLYWLIVPVHDYLLLPGWRAGTRIWGWANHGVRTMWGKKSR